MSVLILPKTSGGSGLWAPGVSFSGSGVNSYTLNLGNHRLHRIFFQMYSRLNEIFLPRMLFNGRTTALYTTTFLYTRDDGLPPLSQANKLRAYARLTPASLAADTPLAVKGVLMNTRSWVGGTPNAVFAFQVGHNLAANNFYHLDGRVNWEYGEDVTSVTIDSNGTSDFYLWFTSAYSDMPQ